MRIYISIYSRKRLIKIININICLRDLSFKKGDMIILRQKIDSNWYQGEANGVVGIFPLSYVQVRHYVIFYYQFTLNFLSFCL